jgi:hypothetical protein
MVPNGQAALDRCGVCCAEPEDMCTSDCTGAWGGTVQLDACDLCAGNNDTCIDCNGVPYGTAQIDQCGVCTANPCTADCNGVYGGTDVMDVCNICGGDGVCRDAVRVSIDLPTGGADFCVDAILLSVRTAVAKAANVSVQYVDVLTCATVSSTATATMAFELQVETGTVRRLLEVANAEPTAMQRQLQTSALMSSLAAGVAAGTGTDAGALSVGAPVTLAIDCLGVTGGLAEVDACNVCGGTNSTCMDCASVPFGLAKQDKCGECDNSTATDCTLDCYGVWGGGATKDGCLVCGGDNSSCSDCAGTPNLINR